MKNLLVFSWGRMNPPTVGHEKLIDIIKAIARRTRADAAMYLSKTTDKVKNPLEYEDKLFYAQKAFGNIIKDTKEKNIIGLLKEISKKYRNIIIKILNLVTLEYFLLVKEIQILILFLECLLLS